MLEVAVIMAAIALYQVPNLVRQKKTRELAGFVLMWLVAAVYAFSVAARLLLPSVTDVLNFVYGKIFNI